jgi:hypothetical protein
MIVKDNDVSDAHSKPLDLAGCMINFRQRLPLDLDGYMIHFSQRLPTNDEM